MGQAPRDLETGRPGRFFKQIPVNLIRPNGSVAFLYDRTIPKTFKTSSTASAWKKTPTSVFEPDDLVILHQAMDEACSFLIDRGALGVAKRRQVALTILRYAHDGMRDPHRLAVKGIVSVG